jgi:carboxymethylenebutenolidase
MKFLSLYVLMLLIGGLGVAQHAGGSAGLPVRGETLQITSGGQSYPAYFAAPRKEGSWPGIVLIHSFMGLEPGYRTMIDKLAAEGFVVIAPEWQTFERSPKDAVVAELIKNAVAKLKAAKEVNPSLLGLTGFCAGGRYTMLFLPQTDFKSGVAFYGFPYSGGFNNESKPADFIGQLKVPLLMIHGTRDEPSKIADIYRYATELDTAGKYFELKVYQGQPHGFMIEKGQLSGSFPAQDSFRQMVTFFSRTLR